MSLEKKVLVDKIEVVKLGVVQVRTATQIIDNGDVITATYHRHTISPGEDYSKEEPRVQAICAAVHTPEVISAYQALLAEQDRNMPGASSGE